MVAKSFETSRRREVLPWAHHAEAVEETGRKEQSLMDAKWVAGRFQISCRHEKLSWTHHREAASLPSDEAREVLDLAEANRWTVRETRAEVSRRNVARKLGAENPGALTCTASDRR